MSKRVPAMDREYAIDHLRRMLPIDTCIYFIQRHISPSGMTHLIEPIIFEDGEPLWIAGLVGTATGIPVVHHADDTCLRVLGTGFDQAWHIAGVLARVLYPDHPHPFQTRWLYSKITVKPSRFSVSTLFRHLRRKDVSTLPSTFDFDSWLESGSPDVELFPTSAENEAAGVAEPVANGPCTIEWYYATPLGDAYPMGVICDGWFTDGVLFAPSDGQSWPGTAVADGQPDPDARWYRASDAAPAIVMPRGDGTTVVVIGN